MVNTPTLISNAVLLDDEVVRILDRRIFPFKVEYVTCRDVEGVALAIEQMVTQSGGPYFAASAGLVLAAREAAKLPSREAREALLSNAAARLTATRPTNNNIRDVVSVVLKQAQQSVGEDDLAAKVEAATRDAWSKRAQAARQLGLNACTMVKDGDVILTHCWAEANIIETLRALVEAKKHVEVICTETRPYLQGARLTAHSVAEMGIKATVIGDNMAAHAMDRRMVDILMTAADRVTLSGHVVNKVGTHQLAIIAHSFNVPYVAMVRAPDRNAKTPADVEMEERDGEEMLHCLGTRTASPMAKGWYPAFDITPPRYVSAIATSVGVFSPFDVGRHFG